MVMPLYTTLVICGHIGRAGSEPTGGKDVSADPTRWPEALLATIAHGLGWWGSRPSGGDPGSGSLPRATTQKRWWRNFTSWVFPDREVRFITIRDGKKEVKVA